MATISERLEALESLLAVSATLQDRIKALETQLQAFTEGMTTGEMRFQFLQELPEGRGKSIADETSAITDALDQFNKSTQELTEPLDLAPRLSPQDVLAISFTAKQGFHPIDLPVNLTPRAPKATDSYRSIDWSVIAKPEPSLANQLVELRVGLGYEQNTVLLPEFTPDTHMGIRVYQPFTDDGSIFVLAKRYTLANRQFEEAIKCNNGREVETTYFVRGVYRTDIAPSSFQKVTLVADSIVAAPQIVASPAPRPRGRDWFIKSGASGGDGMCEKPFRDPFQALDKAEGGDTIHVTGGDYFGKLHSGQWKILIRNLTLLGGYDAEFAERDPWKNPTRFVMNDEERAKGSRRGTILSSEENSEGLVLDGSIFDGSTYNTYTDGSLDLNRSPTEGLVSLGGAKAPITVRNCLFINACTEAISISCP